MNQVIQVNRMMQIEVGAILKRFDKKACTVTIGHDAKYENENDMDNALSAGAHEVGGAQGARWTADRGHQLRGSCLKTTFREFM